MKLLWTTAAVLLIVTGILWALNFSTKKEIKRGATLTTQVAVANKLIDLGEVPLNKPAKGNFKIQNVGPKNLLLMNVETDCSCTLSNWTKRPIPADSFTNIVLSYNAHALGFFQKKAIVTGNFENSPLLLIIRGDVVAEDLLKEDN